MTNVNEQCILYRHCPEFINCVQPVHSVAHSASVFVFFNVFSPLTADSISPTVMLLMTVPLILVDTENQLAEIEMNILIPIFFVCCVCEGAEA